MGEKLVMNEELKVSELEVLRSAAGYYIGRTYTDEYGNEGLPYSRESGYFAKRTGAQSELDHWKKCGIE
jgi:hypothetical protein